MQTAETRKAERQDSQELAASFPVCSELSGGVFQRRVDINRNHVTCGEVLDVVHQQVEFARRKRLVVFRQSADHERNQQPRLGQQPGRQQGQRRQDDADGDEISVITR